MADFENWGDTPGGPDPVQDTPFQGGDSGDDWGSFGDDWGSSSPSDEWGGGQEEWGDGQDSWGDGQDDSTPQGGGAPQQQGSFIPQDDAGWGSTSGVEDQQFAQPNVNDFAQSDTSTDIQEFQPRRVNLSMKKVAFIILIVGVLAALLFLGLDKIHFTKKPQQPSQTNNPPVSQGNTNNQGGQTGQNTQTPSANPGGEQKPNVDSVTLVEIPETMALDYNSDVLEANGKVINKLKYVQGHQVLYCINIGVAVGSSSETVSYYCNYSSFNAVKEGDIVILTYQQVNDTYISVISISK